MTRGTSSRQAATEGLHDLRVRCVNLRPVSVPHLHEYTVLGCEHDGDCQLALPLPQPQPQCELADEWHVRSRTVADGMVLERKAGLGIGT